eukprot:COSAG02_NODE_37425_length_442_cov_0.772595_1_plen_83_part_10
MRVRIEYQDCAAQHLLDLCAVVPDPVQEPLAIRSQILLYLELPVRRLLLVAWLRRGRPVSSTYMHTANYYVYRTVYKAGLTLP